MVLAFQAAGANPNDVLFLMIRVESISWTLSGETQIISTGLGELVEGTK